jgi:predicted dehydrogenase
MTEIRIGLAGAGYWGSKLARNISDAEGCSLDAVCDPDPLRLESVAARYPGSRPFSELSELVEDPNLDALVLSTPAALHAEHTGAALRAGKHVLVEKPLALNSADCEELCSLADQAGLTLMVGHTFIYSEPVRALRRLIRSGELGRILYVYGQRLNLGIIREDLNALWNFGPHDVSILIYLLDSVPSRVSARQFSLLDRTLEDVAFLVLEFNDGVVGHLHESWLDPRKVRQFIVVGDEKMAVYDDTQMESPLQIYDKGVSVKPLSRAADMRDDFGTFKLQVRAGDILSPRVDAAEPLRTEIEHFAECVATGERPLTDGLHGRQVVSILESAERSAADGGAWVPHDEAIPAR